MDSSSPIIEAKDLRLAYGGNTILENLNFSIPRGKIVTILGGSGCGKSTLLKHLIGLYEPAAGTITIDGQNLTNSSGDKRTAILKKIGVAYQSGALFSSMSLLENIRLPLEELTDLPRHAADAICRLKLRLVNLDAYENHLPSELSGGMQKRGAIARAMALDPEILFLDEPSAGLDPVTSAGLDQLILELSRQLHITFVIVTHELASIYAISDLSIMLDKQAKTIIATGHPNDLRDNSTNPTVRQFFLRQPANTN